MATNGSSQAVINWIEIQDPLELTQLRRFCDSESFGAEFGAEPLTPLEAETKKIVEEGTKQLQTGYEVTLPWLPFNHPQVEGQLKSLMRHLEKDPQQKKAYAATIDKYITTGYVHEVVEPEELNHPQQFFLPHHGVYKRSSGKLRIVFSSAAVFGGRSLNTSLLTCPTLQQELPIVLKRFRQGEIACTADIEAMFSRIRLTERDARYHRFL